MIDLKLGEVITTDQKRDAIHVAVVPAVSGERVLRGGDHVGIADGRLMKQEPYLGVVDPFLRTVVLENQKCWLFLYPNTITSLRHEWVHPAFPLPEKEPAQSAEKDLSTHVRVQEGNEFEAGSVEWLTDFALDHGISFDELVEGAVSGEGACFGVDRDTGTIENPVFWQHIAAVTGKIFDGGHIYGTHFVCSC